MPHKMITCANCGNRFEGKYCNMCRQSAETHRITWKEIVHSLPHALFHADRGLFYTMKEMTFRPGITLEDYLRGKRISHFNPFLYLILLGGLCSLLFFSFHIQLPIKEIRMEAIEHANATIAHKYFAVVGMVFILILSVTDFILYRSKGLLMPELIVCNAFQAGQLIFYTMLMLPLFLLQEFLTSVSGAEMEFRIVLMAVVFLYFFYARYQFYEAKGNYGLQLKIILQLLLVYVLYKEVIVNLILHYFHFA